MNKKELVKRAVGILRAGGYKKPVHIPKQRFNISNGGHNAEFTVKPIDRNVSYTPEDVDRILDAVLAAVVEALKGGESVSINGIGSLRVHKRAARQTKNVATGEWVSVEERYVPKLDPGKGLRMAARVYEMKLKDGSNPFFVNDTNDHDDPMVNEVDRR